MLDAFQFFARQLADRPVVRAARAAASTPKVGTVPWAQYPGDKLPRPDATLFKLMQSYRGWVYKAVTVIANRVAEIPFEVIQHTPASEVGGDEEEMSMPHHPIYQLLAGGARRPNPAVTAHHLRKLTQMDLELTGNAFWLKVRKVRGGPPVELWRLRPDRMMPVIDKTTGLLTGWGWAQAGVSQEGKTATFSARDVVHFMYPDPIRDPWLGVGPLRAAADAFDVDDANKKFQRAFFENGSQLSLVLSSEQPISEATAQKILDNFEAKHKGLENAWLPLILGSGLEATPMTAMNKDLEALGLMEFTRDDILSTFGVPKTKVGLGEAINQANANALDMTFNKETINPRLANNREQIEADLINEWPDESKVEGAWHEVRFANPVPEDRDFLLKETETLVKSSVMVIDEARVRHNLDPWGTPLGKATLLASGEVPVDPSSPLETMKPMPFGAGGSFGGGGGDGENAVSENAWKGGRATPRIMPWHTDDTYRARMWNAREERRREWEQIMAGQVHRTFRAQNVRIVRTITDLFRAGQPSVAHVVQAVQSVGGHRQRAEVLHSVATVIARIFRTDGRMAFEFASATKPKLGRAKTNPQDGVYSWQAAARHHLAIRQNMIEGVSDTRFAKIMRVVREAMTTEDYDGGSATIARKLRELFDDDEVQALLVARTESGSAANAASVEGFKAGGANGKGWLATQDERTRDSHRDVDGEVVRVSQPFSNGLQQPGDPRGSAEEVCNCRCTVTPEFLD